MMDFVNHERRGRLWVSALLPGERGRGVCVLVLTKLWSFVHLRLLSHVHLTKQSSQSLRGSFWAEVSA